MVNLSFLTVFCIIAILALYLYIQNSYLKRLAGRDTKTISLLNNLPAAFYYKDLDGNILWVNNEFAQITKRSKQELESQNILDIYDTKYIQNIIREDAVVVKTKRTLSVERAVTFSEEDSEHCYKILKAPVFESDKVCGLIVLFINIDTQKATEASKQSFVATLTHDLKTPTNAQLNTLNMLLDGVFGKLNSEQSEMLTLTKDSCQYMSDLIATIMDTYNFDDGKVELNLEKFDVARLINEICYSSKIMTMKHNQTIDFKNRDEECYIYADKLQIKRVIVNLLSNAITYSYSNNPIIIVLEKVDQGINIFIENKSQQIPQKELDTVFDKFKTTKFSHFNKAATGLGLYLAKQVITLHKGEIYAKSFQDGTCIFGFKIPVSKKINVGQSSNVV